MKKALNYVSGYQLKSACKDAICIAPSKVTQMIFAVLEDWYHHIVLTHSCKLVSFFYIYLATAWKKFMQQQAWFYAVCISAPNCFGLVLHNVVSDNDVTSAADSCESVKNARFTDVQIMENIVV